jgi:hypothetical protein
MAKSGIAAPTMAAGMLPQSGLLPKGLDAERGDHIETFMKHPQ